MLAQGLLCLASGAHLKGPERSLEGLHEPHSSDSWGLWLMQGCLHRLTLCLRDNEAKSSFCKACRAPRWDWQLRARIAAILQHRDLQDISLQQVVLTWIYLDLNTCFY